MAPFLNVDLFCDELLPFCPDLFCSVPMSMSLVVVVGDTPDSLVHAGLSQVDDVRRRLAEVLGLHVDDFKLFQACES